MPYHSINLGKANSGKTVKAIVRSMVNNQAFNNGGAAPGTTEAWDDASVADYAIDAPELGTSGIYAFNTPVGVTFEYVFDFYEAPDGVVDLNLLLGSSYGKPRVVVESYGTGASPAEQVLSAPSNKVSVDGQGRVTTSNPGGGGGSGDEVVIQGDDVEIS